MKRLLIFVMCQAACAPCALAQAQEPGDAARGLDYAKRVCAECHAIRQGDRVSPHPAAPSFEEIARTPGMTGIALSAALHTSHENMPDFTLTQAERNNVIAYILSLNP